MTPDQPARRRRMPSRRVGRRLAAAALLILAASLTPAAVLARPVSLDSFEQDVTIDYGESLILTARASAPAVLAEAWVLIEIAGRSPADPEPVAIRPGQTVEIVHAVSVPELGLPPAADLSIIWVFRDEAGREYPAPPYPLRYHDTSVPWTWSASTQGDMTVYTIGNDPAVDRAALTTAADALSSTRRLLGVPAGRGVSLYVYPDLASMASALRLHGTLVQDWVAAYAIPDQRVALVTAAPGPDFLEGLRRDVPHQITHLVVAEGAGEYAGSVPAWFNEGLALLSALEPDPVLQNTLNTAVREGRRIPLETLCASSFSRLAPRDATLAYAQSQSVMRYISSRYGAAAIRSLMAATADGLSCEDAVRQALGLSLAQLETQWHNDLTAQAARLPSESASLTPWLVIWLVSMGLALLFLAPQPARGGLAVRSGSREQVEG